MSSAASASCYLFPVDGVREQDVAGHAAEQCVARSDVQGAVDHDRPGPVERTALSRDSVDGAIRSDGIDIPDDAPGIGSVCAQVAVEPARKNDPWNRRYRGRLRGTATGTLFTTRMRRFPDDVSGGQIQRPKTATTLGVIPKIHR